MDNTINKKHDSVFVIVKNRKTQWTEYVDAKDLIIDGRTMEEIMEEHNNALKEIENFKNYKKDISNIVKTLAIEVKEMNSSVATDSTNVTKVLNTIAVINSTDDTINESDKEE